MNFVLKRSHYILKIRFIIDETNKIFSQSEHDRTQFRTVGRKHGHSLNDSNSERREEGGPVGA